MNRDELPSEVALNGLALDAQQLLAKYGLPPSLDLCLIRMRRRARNTALALLERRRRHAVDRRHPAPSEPKRVTEHTLSEMLAAEDRSMAAAKILNDRLPWLSADLAIELAVRAAERLAHGHDADPVKAFYAAGEEHFDCVMTVLQCLRNPVDAIDAAVRDVIRETRPLLDCRYEPTADPGARRSSPE